jgi:hypothetical protein
MMMTPRGTRKTHAMADATFPFAETNRAAESPDHGRRKFERAQREMSICSAFSRLAPLVPRHGRDAVLRRAIIR